MNARMEIHACSCVSWLLLEIIIYKNFLKNIPDIALIDKIKNYF